VHEGDEITMKMGENCHRLFLTSFIDSVHFRLLARKMILIILLNPWKIQFKQNWNLPKIVLQKKLDY